jgi:hypothetical protein
LYQITTSKTDCIPAWALLSDNRTGFRYAEQQVVRAISASGASRDRTGDLLLAKQALSQLSYGPVDGRV